MLPATQSRVPLHSAAEINSAIEQQIEQNLAWFAAHPEEIPRRLDELDREWDIERTLEANAAAAAFAGVMLGAFVDRRWLCLPAAVAAFLMQHALQGWCPPLPAFRRLGVRTAAEIGIERYGLKFLRGDFRAVQPGEGGPIDGKDREPVRRLMAALQG